MTNYEKLISDKEYLIDFLNNNGQHDGSDWLNWFNDQYCNKCEALIGKFENGSTCKFAYCEAYQKCKFFEELPEVPDNKKIISMWLDLLVK